MRAARIITLANEIVRARPRTAALAACGLALLVIASAWLVPRVLMAARTRGFAAPSVQPVGDPRARPGHVVTFAEGCAAGCHAELTGTPAVHAPLAADACNACHLPDAGGHTYPIKGAASDACGACHDVGGHDTFQHRAMTEEGCLACHNPHGGNVRALLVGDSVEATCARCHPRDEGKLAHAPYGAGRCMECHDPHGAPNRHLLVGGEGADQCRRCHAPLVGAIESGAHTHRGVEGSCAACHEPHAADRASLLRAEARDLCVSCHRDVGDAVSGARVSHDPVLKDHQCVTCHDPHVAENPKMLRASQPDICLSCHDKSLVARDGRKLPSLAGVLDSPVVHGAITHGDCSACHAVHGAGHERLLRRINPGVLAGAYDIANYALCFECHDQGLVQPGSTTWFRHGERNLHELHLSSGGKSRGCSDCHAVHAGELPRLIATRPGYQGSEWAMPMGIQVTPEGGSCAPACHEPMAYSRRPASAPAPGKGGAP